MGAVFDDVGSNMAFCFELFGHVGAKTANKRGKMASKSAKMSQHKL